MFLFLAQATAEMQKVSLIHDLGAVMLVAGLVAALFHYLGWSKVIGYIVAGALMTNLHGSIIQSVESINVLANLGVIFLMFTLGLELRLHKLKRISNTTAPAAGLDILIMLLVGYAIGRQVFHWDWLPSIFLGAVVCDSSTTLLAKSLEEIHCENKPFASIIFGITLTEDLLTIGLMAILTGLALTGQFQARELYRQLGTLILFLTGILVFGIILLPRFLNTLKRLKDDETLIIIVLGICFGISFLAESLNLSLALGAFLIGAVVAESTVSQRVYKSSLALRNMFSAIFFVTIGMMVKPALLWQQKWAILLLLVAVLLFKTLTNALVTFFAGQPHKEALTIGVGLAQLGDFSYLVALMGIKFTNGQSPFSEMYQIAVGISVISTLINPFLMKASLPFAIWLDRKIPQKVRVALENYTQWSNRAQTEIRSQSEEGRLLRKNLLFYALDLLLPCVIFIVLHFLAELSFWEVIPAILRNHREILLWAAGLLILIPLGVGTFTHVQQIAHLLAEKTAASILPKRLFVHAKRLISAIVWTIFLGIYLFLLGVFSVLLFSDPWLTVTMILAFLVTTIFAGKKFLQIVAEGQQTLEHVLDENRNDVPEPATETTFTATYQLPPASCAIGHKLSTLRIRNHTGMSILSIQRADGTRIPNPNANEILHENDTLTLTGTPEQFEKTKEFLSRKELPQESINSTAFYLNAHIEELSIPQEAPCNGLSLRETDLRNKTGVTVLRIRRADGSILTNPGPQEKILPEDRLSLFGAPLQILDAKKILLPPSP